MTAPIRILLVEDDEVDRMAFRRFVAGEDLPYNYTMVSSVAEAKKRIDDGSFDVIISDYLLGDGTAFDILALKTDIPVIITTGAGDEEIAVRAMKAGAYDYLIKGRGHTYHKILPVVVDKAVERHNADERFRVLADRESSETVVVGSTGMSDVLRLVALAASSDVPVLISGETGTGKNLIAKTIHMKSGARQFPFLSINCTALPENLIEAELFGYEKGAFTGAAKTRKGIVEMAENGTLFLDEIGEMPLHLQSKLLDVLEEKKVRRLGSENVTPVNVRIIAATNINIEEAIGRTFRKDLYYRLSVLRIIIPSLRERSRDIPELCSYLLARIKGGRVFRLSDPEMQRLQQYDWPGNVRELKNILERAVILATGPDLRPSELLGKRNAADGPVNALPDPPEILPLEEMEKRYITAAFRTFSGNVTKTARELGVPLSTFKRKLKEFGLK
ncbi:MAG: sigma-54-dependent Fis family transcriptional regulator [Nitrospirae bacterium]|nr:MAG: sigma-54-dependent Fis family transcriptional regulator [Nitrospirota bacterium]